MRLPDAALPYQAFLDHLKFQKRFSAHTIQAYATDLEQGFEFFQSTFGVGEPSQIQSTMIRSWLAEGKAAGLTPRTLNRKISAFKSFFKYLVRQGQLAASPMASIITPKTPKRLPVFLKEEEALNLLQLLEIRAEDWNSLNAQLILTMLYSTGMRLSELIGLRPEQIDFSRAVLKVLGKGNKERVIPVSPHLARVLKQYLQQRQERFESLSGPVLVTEKGKPLYPKYVWQLVNRLLGQTTTLDKKSPHVLRHTFATHLMNQGADLNAVKELLGHSSLAATQVYTHNTIGKLKDIHRKAHPKS